ncbi:50S ribosomal protein L6 [Candidatus Woesearchaeota archaeon]|nr:50S ribosomal protein L6 [Candidatus Woesearchaeota archaeon]
MAKKKKSKSNLKEGLRVEVEIPEGIKLEVAGFDVTATAGGKSLTRRFLTPNLKISVEGNKALITAERATRREGKVGGTLEAHLKTMFKGVTKGHVYKLKICSGHFPMNVSCTPKEFVIKNFLGEAVPRRLVLPEDVKVTVQGTEITVESINKESAGQTAGNIEQLTKISGRDSRIFQDGIYIVEKDGKKIA